MVNTVLNVDEIFHVAIEVCYSCGKCPEDSQRWATVEYNQEGKFIRKGAYLWQNSLKNGAYQWQKDAVFSSENFEPGMPGLMLFEVVDGMRHYKWRENGVMDPEFEQQNHSSKHFAVEAMQLLTKDTGKPFTDDDEL